MKCRAKRDGLLGTGYIFAGEVFFAEKCPSWAEELDTPKAEKAENAVKAKAKPEKAKAAKAEAEKAENAGEAGS